MYSATAPAAFAAAIATDPARPLITWYDDRTGERAELSGATCANWIAKTANLLVDGCGLGAGDVVVVDLPPHWQTATVLLGCWTAGLRVAGPETAAEVAFIAADRWSAAATGGTPGGATGPATGGAADGRYGEVYCLGFAPLGAPIRQVPPGSSDFIVAVRAYGDEFHPVTEVSPADPATEVSHRELCEAAAERAAGLGISAGDRVLVDLVAYPDPLDWLLAPLVVGASTVLCGELDPAALARRIRDERVTTALTPAR